MKLLHSKPESIVCFQVTLPESLGVDIVSEHVHIDKDGCLYLLGSHVRGRPSYHVVRVPPKGDGSYLCIRKL